VPFLIQGENTMTTVRESNLAGPCIPLGRLEKETASFYCYFDERPWAKCVKRIAKQKAHVEPCRRCEDHPQTQYPNGYMD
jgi:hypothetical protein